MNKFSFYEASAVDEIHERVNSTASETLSSDSPSEKSVIKAGGIDLLDLMKEGIVRPGTLIGIRNFAGMDQIEFDKDKRLRIGANVTLASIASNQQIKDHFFALHQAVSKAATPQIRNMATLGGNLAQRTRCWYFRSKDIICYRKGSSTCFALIGQNQYHSIMMNEYCASVHSSTISTALVALNAAVEISDSKGRLKIVPINEFFVTPDVDPKRENILSSSDLITAIHIPTVKENSKSHYIKMGERESHDWPIADVAVMVGYSGNICKMATIVLGAAAPVPIRSTAAEEIITGKELNKETASAAGVEAMKEATPLSMNAYKIPIFKTLIKRALLATV